MVGSVDGDGESVGARGVAVGEVEVEFDVGVLLAGVNHADAVGFRAVGGLGPPWQSDTTVTVAFVTVLFAGAVVGIGGEALVRFIPGAG